MAKRISKRNSISKVAKKKTASLALASLMSINVALAAMTPLTAFAADPEVNGTLHIKCYDSSVYGADRAAGEVQLSRLKKISELDANSAFRAYWDKEFTNYQFLNTPQGLATFETRTLLVYDVSELDDQGNVIGKLPPDGAYNTPDYYSQKYLTDTANGLGLSPVATLVMKNGELTLVNNNNGTTVISDDMPWVEEDHHYVIIESPDSKGSENGYYPYVDSNVEAWQAPFTWTTGANIDITYDSNVASTYVSSEPLHNEVRRGGISFNVYDKDLQKHASQGRADISGSYFAVYNINYTAETGYTANQTLTKVGWRADGTSTAGYVIADRNNDGHVDSDEQCEYVPAYSESDVVSAYKQYLTQCRTDGKYNGDYSDDNSGMGEFIIGTNSAGKPIIPVMILQPDENGVVSTSASALPYGNYMIVQVQAGTGYYIDEDFRPIISMGTWVKDTGNTKGSVSGYGVAYPKSITNMIRNVGNVVATDSPVAYCTTGTGVSDLSKITSDIFYVNKSGEFAYDDPLSAPDPIYTESSMGPSGGNYLMNADDIRMKPLPGSSVFNANDAVVRGDFILNIADADDLEDAAVHHEYGEYNIDTNGDYIVVPQGNGDLEGAEFKLTNTTPNPVKLYGTGPVLEPGDSYTYKVENNSIISPVDELAYGDYWIEQINTGEGYETGDWSIRKIYVVDENKTTFGTSETVAEDGTKIPGNPDTGAAEHSVNGDIYVPNQIINGGEIYTVESNAANMSDKKLDLAIYNISDNYVYVDKDGDGHKERYETNQALYNAQIKGNTLTRDQLLRITSKWTACKTDSVYVGSPVSHTDTLPYGEYLIVVTGIPEGYNLASENAVTGQITKDGDKIVYNGRLEDLNTVPVIDTVFEDAETFIDSIPVKDRVFLQDRVVVSNLIGGQDYTVYGVIADKETGDILQQGCVAYKNITAYTSTNAGSTISGGNAVSILIAEGTNLTTWNDEYVMWINEVKTYASSIENNTLVNYCDAALSDKDNKNFANNRTLIMGTLKYISGDGYASDSSLDGTAEATVLFNYLDTTDMEGKTLVAYEYVCESTGVKPIGAALTASTTGELLAALDFALLGAHKDVNDEDQTVYIPTLDITAEASYSGEKTIDPSETVKAIVEYGNVEVGNEYVIEAKLYDEFGNPVPDKNGDPYTLTEKTIAYATKDQVEFTFDELDPIKYNGQRLTVYATLYRYDFDKSNKATNYWLIEKGDADSMGYNITDEEPGPNQVDVTAPTIKTVLGDAYGNKVIDFDAKVTLVDKVTYKDLIPGANYESKLTLVNKDGVTLLNDEGDELVAEVEFTAKATQQVVDIPITFNGKDLRGMEIVAYNDLYRHARNNIVLVAQEHNPDAIDQTIEASGDKYKIMISTVAKDVASNTHVVPATGDASAVDTVNVTNLEPSTKYIAVTELAYARNGNLITQFTPVETEFTTETDGSAKFDVNIKFNAAVFAGQKVVVYQTIYDADMKNVIVTHRNKNDANQTLAIPAIDTVATANDGISKKIIPDRQEINLTNKPEGEKTELFTTEVMDTIYYTNLVPGSLYNIVTEIVTRDGKASLGTTTTEFTPITANGTTITFMELDVTKYLNKELVVYETIVDAYSGDTIVVHKDITDLDQTVEIIGMLTPEDPEDPEDDPEDPVKPDDPDDNNPDDPDEDLPSDPENPNDLSDPADPSDPENLTPGDPEDPIYPGDPGKGTDIATGVAENYGLFFGLAAIILAIAAAVGGVYLHKRKATK